MNYTYGYDPNPNWSKGWEKIIDKKLERIMKTPHKPALSILEKDGDHLVLCEIGPDKKPKATDTIVEAKKVGKFEYLEEEVYDPIIRRCHKKGLELNMAEIDTKILRALHPKLDFDAYSYYVGGGFDPFYTHIHGTLFKIKRMYKKANGRQKDL